MNRKNTSIEWKLFRKSLTSELSPEEQTELDRWLRANPENKHYFRKAKDFFQSFENTDDVFEPDSQKAWEDFKRYTRKRRFVVHFPWLRVAAVIAGLSIASYVFFTQFTPPTVATFAQEEIIIEPGRSLAKLSLEDGSVIYLEKQDTLINLQGEQSRIAIDSGRVAYLENKDYDQHDLIPVKNKIDIPHGGEYMIVLADGTKVWLNSESTLEYNVPFKNDEREVILSGEAYFEVAKDASRPFTVKTGKMNIRVLGTHFNVSAYEDGSAMKTTLVEGSIEVSSSFTSSVILKPGEQAFLDRDSLYVKQVNPNLYTAWTQGYFAFEEEPLSVIFQKLSRWYDIEVTFKDKQAEKELFSGKLPRFENFQVILEMICKVSKSEVEMEGKKIIII